MRVIFVRHGETVHNVGMVITSGSPGEDLNERGEEQIQATAYTLRERAPLAVYTSPLLRARHSAEIVGRILGLPVYVDEDFRECDVGTLEGRGGEADFARFNEALDRWYLNSDLDFPLGPGGENPAAALARARSAISRIRSAHAEDDTVVVMAHQTLLQLILTFLSNNLAPSFGHRRWIANGGAGVLEFTGAECVCTEWDGKPVEALLSE